MATAATSPQPDSVEKLLQDKVARVEQAYRAAVADDRDRRRDEYLDTLKEWMNYKVFGEVPAAWRRTA